MPDVHDPAALLRHATQAGDWRLVYLITRMLSGRSTVHGAAARRAYTTLLLKLGLLGDGRDYHRA